MKINADIYVKDVPGQLVASLEPISTVGGNIIGVVHNREQLISGRISVNIIFTIEQENLDRLKKIWKSRDVIISKMGEDVEIYSMDYMLIGSFNAAYMENIIDKASKEIEFVSVDFGYSSNMSTKSRAAMISAKLRSKDDLYKLNEFISKEAKDAGLTYIRGVRQ